MGKTPHSLNLGLYALVVCKLVASLIVAGGRRVKRLDVIEFMSWQFHPQKP